VSATEPTPPERRRVVHVVGAPGAGADLLAGTLGALGAGSPTDPAWLADLGVELFARCSVVDDDARPEAWYSAGKLSQFERLRIRVSTWLEQQLTTLTDVPEDVRVLPELVLADPRLIWFHGLWRSASMRCGAAPTFAIALGPGAPTVAADDPDPAAASRATAAWLNLVLHTERATRGSARAFVRRADLVDDWTGPLFRLGPALDLASVQEATANAQRAVHALLEPARVAARAAAGTPVATWADLPLPTRLRELAEATEAALDTLADDDHDAHPAHARLDGLRADYTALHGEAAALTESGRRAAHNAGALAATEAGGWPLPWVPTGTPASRPSAALTPPDPRGADRVPHRLRAALPPGLRRGLRRAVGRARDARPGA